MAITVRKARPADVAALVRLRIANAQAHVELDPARFRVPDAEAVRGHFERVVRGWDVLILVAEVDGQVAGMVEVVPAPVPPDHQILIPRQTADIHTVVLAEYRDLGLGRALIEEAERAAAQRGVVALGASILTLNEGALRFYAAAGYGPHGTWLRKELGR